MRSGYWKAAVILLSLGMVVSTGWLGTFHSESGDYSTGPQYNGNGTAIVVVAQNSVSVNGKIQIFTMDSASTVLLENGTSITMENVSTFHPYILHFHFSGSLFTGQSVSKGGILNISISNSHPIAIAELQNVSQSFFMNYLPSYVSGYGSNVHYFMIYAGPYQFVRVSAVGGVL